MSFVVCGEALIDLVPDATKAATPVASSWRAQSAGGPMNTAIALARLGEDVEFCGRVSTDAFGQQIAQFLAHNDVGDRYVVRSGDPTSLAVVSLDADGKASYAFHLEGTANFRWQTHELPDLADDDWLHIASLALIVPPANVVLAAWAREHTGPMSIDVNVRPTVLPDPDEYWRRIEPWFEVLGERRGILKASDEDLAFLARGAGLELPPVEAAAQWREQYGFSAAVTTLGAEGVHALTADGDVLRVPGREIDLVDTIGAGDTFMGAFLRAHRESGLEQALVEGIAASALVCERRGAQPPLAAEVAACLESER